MVCEMYQDSGTVYLKRYDVTCTIISREREKERESERKNERTYVCKREREREREREKVLKHIYIHIYILILLPPNPSINEAVFILPQAIFHARSNL